MERHYPLRVYTQDILPWIAATDRQPHHQVAAIIQRLTGMAKELARLMNPGELMHGGVINGVFVDPVTLLFHALQIRFGPLAEKSCLQALAEMMHFHQDKVSASMISSLGLRQPTTELRMRQTSAWRRKACPTF